MMLLYNVLFLLSNLSEANLERVMFVDLIFLSVFLNTRFLRKYLTILFSGKRIVFVQSMVASIIYWSRRLH